MIRALRVAIRPVFVKGRLVPIRHPFGHIAGHIEDAIRTDCVVVLVHRNDGRVEQQSFRAVPHRSGQPRPSIIRPRKSRHLVPPGVDTAILTPRGFLPLCFGRQPLAGPLAIAVRIMPGDMHHRVIRHRFLKDSSPFPIDQGLQALGQNVSEELDHRHFVLVDLIGVHLHGALRELRGIRVAVDLPVAPHQERAGRNQGHLVLRRKRGQTHRLFPACLRPLGLHIGHVSAPTGHRHNLRGNNEHGEKNHYCQLCHRNLSRPL